MDEPAPMRVIQCIGELDGVAQRLRRRQRTSQETLRQRLALEIFHDEEPDRLGARLVGARDSGLRQCRSRSQMCG